MSGFNDWIYFDPKPLAAVENLDEVDQLARASLAKSVQQRLRGRLDVGLRQTAQAVRVQSEGDRLIIEEDDAGAILDATAQAPREESSIEATEIDQLFQTSSGVPKAIRGPDGQSRVAFRTISLEALFGAQQRAEQADLIERTMGEAIRDTLGEAYETAIAEVNNRHPESTT